MRAFAITHAGANAIELTNVPKPHLADGELLVRVKAIGVGIHDSYFLPPDHGYPYVIGIEAAGVVEEVGESVTGYQFGDRIAFVSSMQPKGGTWAEFAVVSADSLVIPIPPHVDFVTAAAIPVAGNTALRALSALNKVPDGGTLFVAGGSGAIGTLAVQIARGRTWRVGATSSEINHQYLKSLGVEMVADYHDPDWTDQVVEWSIDGVDAAMAVQPDTTTETLRVIKNGGQVISISGDSVATQRGIEVATIPYQTDVRADLIELMSDIADEKIRVEIEHVYAFEEAPTALAKVQTRRARGKSILQML